MKMQNVTRINSYFISNAQKPSPLRQTFVVELRQKNKKTRGIKQISPDCGRIFSEARTPSYNKPLKVDYSFQILNVDEKQINKEDQQPQQMKKSPSYRLKTFKRPQSKINMLEEKRDSFKSRITNLENFVYHLQEKNEVQQINTNQNTRSLNNQIKKAIQVNQNNNSQQSTQITILEDQENNIEELHFLLVQFQQKCKTCYKKIDNPYGKI